MTNFTYDTDTETTPDGRQRCQEWWGEREELSRRSEINERMANSKWWTCGEEQERKMSEASNWDSLDKSTQRKLVAQMVRIKRAGQLRDRSVHAMAKVQRIYGEGALRMALLLADYRINGQ